jgi:cytochrome c-type biogenesis protein CcmH/NrfG
VRLRPLSARLWAHFGLACAMTGRPERAAEAFRTSLRIDPDQDEVLFNLAA